MATKKEKVTNKNFEELLLKSASEAVDYSKGKVSLNSYQSSFISEPPKYTKTRIKKIRSELGVSQAVFAKIFGESTSAIQHWEQGTRNMSKSASRLLALIEKDAETIFSLIHNDQAS